MEEDAAGGGGGIWTAGLVWEYAAHEWDIIWSSGVRRTEKD